jgi:hypothetical protein
MWFSDPVGVSLRLLEVLSIGMTLAGEGFNSVHRVEISSAYRLEPMVMISRLVAMRSGCSLTKRSGGFFRMSHMYLKVPGTY